MKCRFLALAGLIPTAVILAACGTTSNNNSGSTQTAHVVNTPTAAECVGRWNVDNARPNIFSRYPGLSTTGLNIATSGTAITGTSQCEVLVRAGSTTTKILQIGTGTHFFVAAVWDSSDSNAEIVNTNVTMDKSGTLAVKK